MLETDDLFSICAQFILCLHNI